LEREGPFVLLLSRLEQGESRLELVGNAAELDIDPSRIKVAGPVVVRALLYRRGDKVEVQGTVAGAVEQLCDRCTAPVRAAISAPVRVFSERRDRRDRRRPEEIREDDLGMVYHDGQRIDLTEEIRQVFLLEVPWHVLCADDCRGLCPRCGADRNRVACACEESSAPRWSALRRLRDERN
jgi:uncharacterized protein